MFDPVPRSLALAGVFLILLNLVDTFSTLWHTSFGATELNPVMAWVLGFGPFAFFLVKYLLTAVTVIVMAGTRERKLSTIFLCYVLIPLYSLIAIYQTVGYRLFI